MDWLNTGMPWMTDVMMWSQQFGVFALGNAKPGDIFQTRVYGFDGLQTRVPGFDYVSPAGGR